ncbi:Rossmann-fold NAD(P)-binding domain-containing protein [Leifsonella bigeumensis]|uniref:hypothetical protein n=1 Tax=Leifsonella bigeumensis TaxID=433643 RepID=UPI0031E4056C
MATSQLASEFEEIASKLRIVKPQVAVIGRGHVGRAQIRALSDNADVFSWDISDDTDYPVERLRTADLAIVCVPTPSLADGSCDTSIVEGALSMLPTDRVLLRSTVPPGFTRGWAEKTGTCICYSPEYIGETPIPIHSWGDDAQSVPFLLLGGTSDARLEVIKILGPLLAISRQVFECTSDEAELIKYMENAYLATKLTFVNVFYDVAERIGADWSAVRTGWLLDPRVGDSHTLVFPSDRGFGGSCLPKDLDAITDVFRKVGISSELFEAVRRTNEIYRTQ